MKIFVVTADVELKKRLAAVTDGLRHVHNFPIFCSTDVFGETGLWKTFSFHNYPEDSWLTFWRSVLRAGYITDVSMTPGWVRSKGAKDEYETAKNANLNIRYL